MINQQIHRHLCTPYLRTLLTSKSRTILGKHTVLGLIPGISAIAEIPATSSLPSLNKILMLCEFAEFAALRHLACSLILHHRDPQRTAFKRRSWNGNEFDKVSVHLSGEC
jgi:hypothetical protein